MKLTAPPHMSAATKIAFRAWDSLLIATPFSDIPGKGCGSPSYSCNHTNNFKLNKSNGSQLIYATASVIARLSFAFLDRSNPVLINCRL